MNAPLMKGAVFGIILSFVLTRINKFRACFGSNPPDYRLSGLQFIRWHMFIPPINKYAVVKPAFRHGNRLTDY